MFSALLSHVPLGTGNFLAYAMLGLVTFFLVFGPATAYYLWRKRKQMTADAPKQPASPPSGGSPSSGTG